MQFSPYCKMIVKFSWKTYMRSIKKMFERVFEGNSIKKKKKSLWKEGEKSR